MNTQEKIAKLKDFPNEKAFREFLIDFLKKRGFDDVFHTHRFGSPEQGKDIIAKHEHPVDGVDWYAFVVKHGRIGGGTNEIETIKNQIKQSFEYPYQGLNGEQIKINKVKVVTNENITGGAQSQISQSPELRMYNNFDFWWNENLVDLIDKFYDDFWLPGDAFSKEYSLNFTKKLNAEIEIRELSIRKVDDKQLQKLLDIFIEPKLTLSEVEEDRQTKEKVIKRHKLTINSFQTIKENLLISGDQGSGKTKILNTIACRLGAAEIIDKTKKIPIRLKAPLIRDFSFDIKTIIKHEVKSLSNIFWNEALLKKFTPILFIDDFDLLKAEDRQTLISRVKEFCDTNNTNYIITYRKSELEHDKSLKSIKIHNFNVKQIESFISKYFEGSDRGSHFIRVLKESGLLSKLPTTPLTITLISLLYDENNFEIPATLSDIYTDFVEVLLGKLEIRNRQELLVLNLKRRVFSKLALDMMLDKNFEMEYANFVNFVNAFLDERGYQKQTEQELEEIIFNSGLLYKDDNDIIGFKQQAFVEFFASIEIYHHSREKHYQKLITHFNDITWQNTAIFYAGHAKELEGMIDDVIRDSPNENLSDWFITTGGMGYLSQALYQTTPKERKKLVFKAQDNILRAYNNIRQESSDSESFWYEIPLPFICGFLSYWFAENFKSITLKETLTQSFEEIISNNPDTAGHIEFETNFKLLMIASTLMNPYINEESCFERLLERKSFMNHPILPLVADMILENGLIDKKQITPANKEKITAQIKKKREYIKAVLKEPAYRFNDDFGLEK